MVSDRATEPPFEPGRCCRPLGHPMPMGAYPWAPQQATGSMVTLLCGPEQAWSPVERRSPLELVVACQRPGVRVCSWPSTPTPASEPGASDRGTERHPVFRQLPAPNCSWEGESNTWGCGGPGLPRHREQPESPPHFHRHEPCAGPSVTFRGILHPLLPPPTHEEPSLQFTNLGNASTATSDAGQGSVMVGPHQGRVSGGDRGALAPILRRRSRLGLCTCRAAACRPPLTPRGPAVRL